MSQTLPPSCGRRQLTDTTPVFQEGPHSLFEIREATINIQFDSDDKGSFILSVPSELQAVGVWKTPKKP